MKKNGFVSTTLIYTFFVIFLLLMVFLLNSYSSVRFMLDSIKYDLKDGFAYENSADLNLYTYVWDNNTKEYELASEIPSFGYVLNEEVSYCKNGSTLTYSNGELVLSSTRKDSCYAYFDETEKDIILKIYAKDASSAERKEVKSIPSLNYELTSSTCTNGATIEFDNSMRKFTVSSSVKTVCEVEFTKKVSDVTIHLFKQSASGTTSYEGLNYEKTNEIPYGYSFRTYSCTDTSMNTNITYVDGEIVVISDGRNECNVYFTGEESNIDLQIMQESSEGVNGYTTGKKYVRTFSVPSVGYKYVGYICDDSSATVTFSGGTLLAEGDKTTTCRAYFDKYSGNYYIHYLLQKSDGNYEEVATSPSTGYSFNSAKSSCNKGGSIFQNGNIIEVNTTEDDDECFAYFDLINKDIIVNVYVMDKTTNKYALGNVPVVGYKLLSKECTNGASIDYVNGAIKVTSNVPTVCTVYFR